MFDLEDFWQEMWRKDWRGMLGQVVLSFKRARLRGLYCQ